MNAELSINSVSTLAGALLAGVDFSSVLTCIVSRFQASIGISTAVLTGLVVVDYMVFIDGERLQSIKNEAERQERCRLNDQSPGCEKEAMKNAEQKKIAKEKKQAEVLAAAKHEERVASLTPHCAAIAKQHLYMRTMVGKADIPDHMVLANVYWHDAGCNDYFGSVRNSEISSHPLLPEDWMSLNYKEVFPSKKCTVTGSGTSGLMTCEKQYD